MLRMAVKGPGAMCHVARRARSMPLAAGAGAVPADGIPRGAMRKTPQTRHTEAGPWMDGGHAETRDQTGDFQIFSLTLSQLSYRGLILSEHLSVECYNT